MTESCRLYLISPPNFFLDDFEKQLLNALSGGDVACFQLRLKDTDDNAIRDASKRLMPICRNYDVAFLINDRPDLAAEMGADGVHVGSDDVTYEVARRIVGSEATVGVSCYNSWPYLQGNKAPIMSHLGHFTRQKQKRLGHT